MTSISNTIPKILLGLVTGVSLAAAATTADAALIVDGPLTLNTDPIDIFQQTAANPCVIGGNNCLNGTFPMTVSGSGGAGTDQSLDSPTYTIAQIQAAIGGGNAFTIALDYNQTVDPQELRLFSAAFNVGGTQTFDIPTILQVNNNGVGFSDFLLTGFVIPAGATSVTFHATWFDNDGPDRYFLIGANSVPVPEPSTLAVLGLGLLGLAALARRRVV